jgi:hypothetical protein
MAGIPEDQPARSCRRPRATVAGFPVWREIADRNHPEAVSGQTLDRRERFSPAEIHDHFRSGLDLPVPMFAPCLLGCPGTPRQEPVRTGTAAVRRPVQTARPGIVRYRSTSKIELSSGLLIRGFGVRVPGGAPVLTWGFIAPGHFYVPGLSRFPARARSLCRSNIELRTLSWGYAA